MSEKIELNYLDNQREEIKDVEENEDETDFGGGEKDYPLLFGPEYYIDDDKVKSGTNK